MARFGFPSFNLGSSAGVYAARSYVASLDEPADGPPSEVQNLLVTPNGGGQVTVTWSDPADWGDPNGHDFDGRYHLSNDGGSTFYSADNPIALGATSPKVLSGLTPGNVILVEIRAYNVDGVSGYAQSNMPTIT